MRQEIDTAPRDGSTIVLEDDSSGTYEIAEWCKDVGAWVDEHGSPVKITPAYWHALPRNHYSGSESESRSRSVANRPRFIMPLIAVASMTAAGIYFKTGLEAAVGPYVSGIDISRHIAAINDFGRSSTERATASVAQALIDLRQSVAGQGWAIPPAHDGNGRAESAGAGDAARTAVRASSPDTGAEFSRVEPRGLARAAGTPTEPRLNGNELSHSQIEEERARNQAIETELEMARRQIEMNARLVHDIREQARLEQVAMERDAQARIGTLVRDLDAARRALESSTDALNSARSEAQEHRLKAELAAADARRERERGRLLAKKFAEARLEIETKAALLGELRKNSEKLRLDVERTSGERPHERSSAGTAQGN